MGILKQTGRSEFTVTNTFRTNNFPSELLAGDIDADGITEVMAFGANFPGLMVIDYKNHSWKSKTFEKGKSFSTGAVCDVNNDGSLDFVAFDIKSGMLDFFYNNSRGEFSLVRSVNYSHFPEEITSADVNNDGYPDIVYVAGSEMEVLYGDNVHSYSAKKMIHLPFAASGYTIGDFNDDGRNDIAIAGGNPQELALLFQNNAGGFHAPVTYLTQEEIEDIQSYSIAGKNCIAVLSDKDNFRIFSRLENKEKFFMFPFTGPGDILLTPQSFSEKVLFSFIDVSKNNLCAVVSSGKGYSYYESPLPGQYAAGFYDIVKDQRADFFLADYYRQQILYLSLDLKSARVERNFFRYDGKLLDAGILQLSQNDKRLSLLSRMHLTIRQTIFNYEKPGTKPSELTTELPGCKYGKSVNPKTNLLFSENKNVCELYAWNTIGKTKSLLSGNKGVGVNKPGGFTAGDLFGDKKSRILSIFTEGEEYCYTISGGNDRSGKIRNIKGGLTLPELSDMGYYSANPNRAGFVLAYSNSDKTLYHLDMKQSSAAILKPLLAEISPASYILKQIGKNGEYLLVTLKDGNGIIAKKLE